MRDQVREYTDVNLRSENDKHKAANKSHRLNSVFSNLLGNNND